MAAESCMLPGDTSSCFMVIPLFASWLHLFCTQLLLPCYAAALPGRIRTHSSSTAADMMHLLPAGDEQTGAMLTPRRDLNFGATDSGEEAAQATVSPEASTSATAPDAGKANAASAGLPVFRRAVSFSNESQVLQPRAQAQGAVRQYQPFDGSKLPFDGSNLPFDRSNLPFDGSNLPDGITAIPVVDPDDPTVIVMQVSCHFLLQFA